MSTLGFRISELAELDEKPRKIDARARPHSANRRIKEIIPLSFFDYNDGEGHPSFCWDISGNGWGEGYWLNNGEIFGWYANEGLDIWRGTGSISYTRAGTTTRTNIDSVVETVAVNQVPYDYIVGPNGNSRYAPRFDASGAICSFPTDRNAYRREGSVTAWVSMNEWNSGSIINTVFGGNNIALAFDTSLSKLVARITNEAGSIISTDYTYGTFADDSWHLLGMSWNYAEERLRVWMDGELKNGFTAGALAVRPAELQDNWGIACNYDTPTTTYLDGKLIDFRVWASEMNATLFDYLYKVKA